VLTSDELVTRLSRVPDRTALFTDFDGTLAPIVADPAAARPFPGAVEALTRLTGRYRRVAVLSGRPLDFLDPLLPAGVDIGALYGLEQRVAGVRREHPGAAPWRAVVTELAERATRELAGLAGVHVEPKGISLTLHFRNGPAHETAVVAFARQAAATTGLHPRPAKASVELHPPVSVDKGTLLQQWSDDADVAAFIGDDVGDLAAFDAVHDLGRRAGGEGYAVAVAGDETPGEVRAAADALLDSPAAVVALFQRLAAAS
jgi:trehalose 6-phosphate phosphatase